MAHIKSDIRNPVFRRAALAGEALDIPCSSEAAAKQLRNRFYSLRQAMYLEGYSSEQMAWMIRVEDNVMKIVPLESTEDSQAIISALEGKGVDISSPLPRPAGTTTSPSTSPKESPTRFVKGKGEEIVENAYGLDFEGGE